MNDTFIEIQTQTAAAQTSANAAKSAADSAANQLVLDQRPWVALDTSTDNGIVLYEDMKFGYDTYTSNWERVVSDNRLVANFALRYSLKNFGRSPAYVEISTKVITSPTYPVHGNPLTNKIEAFCDKDYRDRVSRGSHIWPATSVPGTMSYNIPQSMKIDHESVTRGTIKPTVIGCIWYRSTTGEIDRIYKTQFSGNISMKEGNGHRADDLNPIAIPVGNLPLLKDQLEIVDALNVGKAD